MTNDGYRSKLEPSKRLADLRGGKETAEEAEEFLNVEDSPEENAFSLRSADRHQKIMLELRFKDGNAKAIAYSYLVAMDFNPSKAITMDFSGYEVRISGRSLGPLFAGLVAQRVAVVRETDALHAEATVHEGETVVTRIEVREPGQT